MPEFANREVELTGAPAREAVPAGPLAVVGRMLRAMGNGMAEALLHRVTGLVALVLLAAGLALSFVELPAGSTCGMKLSTGLPCPGCGMTRSVQSTFHGNLLAAWQYNPFGPIFLTVAGLVGSLALLPGGTRRKLAAKLGRFDPLLFVAVLVLFSGLIVWGGARALLVHAEAEGYSWWRTAEERPPALVERNRGE